MSKPIVFFFATMVVRASAFAGVDNPTSEIEPGSPISLAAMALGAAGVFVSYQGWKLRSWSMPGSSKSRQGAALIAIGVLLFIASAKSA